MANTFLHKADLAPRINIKLFGNWDKTIRTIQRLDPTIKKCSIKAQLKVATEIQKKVKAHIRNQDLGWKPLSDEYLQDKLAKGLSGGILMAYKAYYENITVWHSGNQHFVYVGVKKNIYTRNLSGGKSKLPIDKIAFIHEFASGKRYKRRPLWNPTIAEMGGARGLRKMYINSLKWHLRKNGVPVDNVIKSL